MEIKQKVVNRSTGKVFGSQVGYSPKAAYDKLTQTKIDHPEQSSQLMVVPVTNKFTNGQWEQPFTEKVKRSLLYKPGETGERRWRSNRKW